MSTMRYNGEEWYEDRRSLPKRVRQWVIRCGWDRPVREGRAYNTRWDVTRWRDPFPISLFGRRVSLFDSWISIRVGWRYLHWGFRRNPSVMYGPYGTGYAYLSRDGTPHHAHHWLWGWRKWYGWHGIERGMR